MDLLQNLYLGFSVALHPTNIMFCFIGVFLGTLVGVLPGIGPGSSIALLFPLTFHLNPETAIIMLAGIYYGSQYGGSTTSILVNIPGEASSVVTCLDGYQMAKNGKAGPAIGIAAIGSFIGGTASVVGLMLIGPAVATFALRFGPPEFFALTCMSIIILSFLSKGSILKCFIAALLGLFVGTIGTDRATGDLRFTYGSLTLLDGVGLIPVIMGLFGVAEVFANLEMRENREIFVTKLKGFLPSWQDWRESIGPIGRGTVLGFILGMIPGTGPAMSSFTSYAMEKRLSKHPENFGKGAIAGLAGPETTNNAAATSGMIPLFSLGLPTGVIMSLFLGALMVHGVAPSPLFVKEDPQIFWGIVASMYIGNAMLLVLNLPLIPLWVKILKVPYGILFPMILFFCIIGVYSLNENAYEILIMLLFGIIGYLMRKTGFEAAPFVFAMIIGPLMETNLRRALVQSRGDLMIFFKRPISAFIMVICLILLISQFLPKARKTRKKAEQSGV